MKEGLILLAHVRKQSHFVLITGLDPKDPQNFLVNDPGFNRTSYAYSEMHDIIIYDII